MTSRLGKLLILLVLVLFAFTGCSVIPNEVRSVGEKHTDRVHITVFGNKTGEGNIKVMESIMTAFMKENPDIEVTYESIGEREYYDALELRMAGNGGNDIFFVNHDMLLKLENEGKLADLSGLEIIDYLCPLVQSQIKNDDGSIHWIPITISAVGLYCNEDVLARHHQKIPENLTEWRAINDYFLSQGITPIAANNSISLGALAIGASLSNDYHAEKPNSVITNMNNGTLSFSSVLRPGYALVSEFINKGYIQRDLTLQGKTGRDELQQFAQGKNPFMITVISHANELKSNYRAGFNFAIYPLPALEDGCVLLINPDSRLCVNAASKYPDEAKKFINYFTKFGNLQKFAQEQCSFSPIQVEHGPVIDELKPIGKAFDACPIVIGWDSRLRLPVSKLTTNAVRMLLAGNSLNSTLSDMDAEVARYLIQNK